MVLLTEQGFTLPGEVGQTVLQVWQAGDARFLVREVPDDKIAPDDREFTSMHEAIAAMKAIVVARDLVPAGRGRAKHLRPNPANAAPASRPAPVSRFDREDVI